MKLVSFERDGGARAGIWKEDGILDIHTADPSLPSEMTALLAAGEETLLRLRTLRGSTVPASGVRLLTPVPRPGKIVCCGQNYWDHCREQKVDPPTSPIFFAKFNNTLLPAGNPIRLNPATEQVDYEAELALVIGKTAKNVPEDRALEYVAGYTCANDVSARDLQFADKQWTRGKSVDTFCPLGPYLVTRDEIADPQALAIRCTVSGEVLQNSNTREMIFSCAFLIAYLTRTLTLEPGDVLLTGTPDGVGVFRKPPRLLKAGDTVTVSIEGVGELTNPVAG